MCYDVDLTVIGSHEWCERAKAAIDEWTLRMVQSGEAPGAETILPDVDVAPLGELCFGFVGIPADNSMDAVKRAASVLELIAPDVLDKEEMRITVLSEHVADAVMSAWEALT